jgi:hypothetical protein
MTDTLGVEIPPMPGSPVSNVRRLQTVIFTSSGRHVTSLALVQALIGQMEASGSLRFSRESLEDYADKLRNWQIADSVIADAIRAKEAALQQPRSLMDDPPPYQLKGYYATYAARAKEAGLRPLAYATFKTRASDFPSSSRHLLRSANG